MRGTWIQEAGRSVHDHHYAGGYDLDVTDVSSMNSAYRSGMGGLQLLKMKTERQTSPPKQVDDSIGIIRYYTQYKASVPKTVTAR